MTFMGYDFMISLRSDGVVGRYPFALVWLIQSFSLYC
jgi:hypothetical protein